MKNKIKNLKASLEVVRDYAKEAENLVTQINKETENIRKEYDLTLPQIKDMIHEDMHVLKEFSNPKYPDTTRLTVCVGQENGLHFKAYILLSDEGEYKKPLKSKSHGHGEAFLHLMFCMRTVLLLERVLIQKWMLNCSFCVKIGPMF